MANSPSEGALPKRCRCNPKIDFWSSPVYRVETEKRGAFLVHLACSPPGFWEVVQEEEAADRQRKLEKIRRILL